jgi:LPS sulfotransferase NodH
MGKQFDSFVVLAEMRTGSNFLEANINEIDGLTCYGEAFNPHFIGYPNRSELVGMTQAMRDGDPLRLISEMKRQTDGISGFRFFHSHDARILDRCLPDERCAKIILTRNPLESYVSWKIAQATDQWKLTNLKFRRTARIVFDQREFETHLAALQAFQVKLLNALQVSGQTAFYIAYEDISDVDVINGLAAFLGAPGRKEQTSSALKRQNPAPLRDKVKNFGEMEAALGDIDHFNLGRTPNFEPRRGAVVPTYVAAENAPLMYLPIKGGPETVVREWLAGVGDGVIDGFNQKTLRQWKRKHAGHRGFSVITHPVERAHRTFCTRIVDTGPDSYPEIRDTLRKVYKLPLPGGSINENNYDKRTHRTAFLAFLEFIGMNLNGQTGVRVDAAWASQAQVLQGIGQFALPDMVIRCEHLAQGLTQLAQQIGCGSPEPASMPADTPFSLDDIYDKEIEAAARSAYQRDYMMFGYKAWSAL